MNNDIYILRFIVINFCTWQIEAINEKTNHDSSTKVYLI